MTVIKSHNLELPAAIFALPSVPVFFTDWTVHIPFLRFLIAHLSPKTFVELGVLDGNSYFAACETVQNLGIPCRCYAIDPWEGTFQQHQSRAAHMAMLFGAYSGNFYKPFLDRNTQFPFSIPIRAYSGDALHQFNDGEIDLLHIDANHRKDEVLKDFHSWLPKVSTNGIILLHDIANRDESNEAGLAWDEIKPQFKTFENKFGNGLGVVFKGAEYSPQIEQLYAASEEEIEYADTIFECLGILYRLAQEAYLSRVWPNGCPYTS